ncbi:MAG: D-arabinono-1,4-lactone oxidase, partial [Bacteroidota bacterium]
TIGTGIEFAFPVDEVVKAVDGIMAFVEQQAKNKTGLSLNAPMALRFVRPSKAYLAHNYHHHHGKEVTLWCYIEILRINSKNNAEEDARELELYRQLQQLLFMAGGRPHWGLNFDFPFNQQNLNALYPKYATWKASFDFFNPSGTFDNDFVRKSGIRSIA